jgi:hypothetical protein
LLSLEEIRESKADAQRRLCASSINWFVRAAVMLLCEHHTYPGEIEHPPGQVFLAQLMNGLGSLFR